AEEVGIDSLSTLQRTVAHGPRCPLSPDVVVVGGADLGLVLEQDLRGRVVLGRRGLRAGVGIRDRVPQRWRIGRGVTELLEPGSQRLRGPGRGLELRLADLPPDLAVAAA